MTDACSWFTVSVTVVMFTAKGERARSAPCPLSPARTLRASTTQAPNNLETPPPPASPRAPARGYALYT